MTLIQAIKENNQAEFFRLLNLKTDSFGKRIIDEIDAEHGGNALHAAITYGRLHFVAPLIEAGVALNEPDNDGWTPVYIAADTGDAEIITILKAGGADVDRPNSDGVSPISVAAENGHVRAIAALGAAGANMYALDNQGFTPLDVAVEMREALVVRALLEAGADADIKTLRDTLLEQARGSGKSDVVEVIQLLEAHLKQYPNGIKIASKNTVKVNSERPGEPEGKAQAFMEKNRNNSIAGALPSSLVIQKDLSKRGEKVFTNQAQKQETAPLDTKHLLEGGQSPDLLNANTGDSQASSLIEAVKQNNEAEVSRLLDLKTKLGKKIIEEVDEDGNNALYWVAALGYVHFIGPLIKTIVALKATDMNANKPNKYGITAVHAAAAMGRDKIILAFKDIGVNVDMPTKKNGITPLYIAAQKGHIGAVKALLEADADASIQTKYGTALECARQNKKPGHPEIARLLEAHFKRQYPNGIKPASALVTSTKVDNLPQAASPTAAPVSESDLIDQKNISEFAMLSQSQTFTKSSFQVSANELTAFLRFVVEGEQDKAEAALKNNPALALAPADVTDLSKRTFKNITALQYALWALDWHMWTMLLKYMPSEAVTEQIAQSERGLWVLQHGVTANWENLIEALNQYVSELHSNKPESVYKQTWIKQVGGAQLLLPAHVINEYCHPTRPFHPTPDFAKPEPSGTWRSRATAPDKGEWFSAKCGGGTLGEGFAVYRGTRITDAVCTTWEGGGAPRDIPGVAALLKTRRAQRASVVAQHLSKGEPVSEPTASASVQSSPAVNANPNLARPQVAALAAPPALKVGSPDQKSVLEPAMLSQFQASTKSVPAPASVSKSSSLQVNANNLAEFLRFVAEGEQDKAEAMLKSNPDLALLSGDVTDLSKRTFTGITGFQYAVWALDWHMWTMIRKYLPHDAAREQAQGFETGAWVKSYNVHAEYLLDNLIKALQATCDVYWAKKYRESDAVWVQQVGGAQLLLPAHVINEYCHPTRRFHLCPNFKDAAPLPRGRAIDKGEWFTAVHEGGKLGNKFAVYRATAVAWMSMSTNTVDGEPFVRRGGADDQAVMRILSSTRIAQRKKLIIELSVRNTARKVLLSSKLAINVDTIEENALQTTVSFATKSSLEGKNNSSAVLTQFKQILKPALPVSTSDLQIFLTLVAEGEQDKVEMMLKSNSALALVSGDVTDLSKRTFTGITGFQYAVWALDWHMWTMIRKYLPDEVAREQAESFEMGVWVQEHGVDAKHLLENLIDALQSTIDLYNENKLKERDAVWVQQVGKAQLLLPAHVINEYCHPTRLFDPCPNFRDASILPRTRKTSGKDWFLPDRNGKLLGVDFAHRRGWATICCAVPRSMADFADIAAVYLLTNTRSDQHEELFAELKRSDVPQKLLLSPTLKANLPDQKSAFEPAMLAQFRQFTKPSRSVSAGDLTAFLRFVAEGEQDKAEAMLKSNPDLALIPGDVRTLA